MRLSIKINLDNEAFEKDWKEEVVKDISNAISRCCRTLDDEVNIRDSNGNKVGYVKLYI